jgi:hypothetical protein
MRIRHVPFLVVLLALLAPLSASAAGGHCQGTCVDTDTQNPDASHARLGVSVRFRGDFPKRMEWRLRSRRWWVDDHGHQHHGRYKHSDKKWIRKGSKKWLHSFAMPCGDKGVETVLHYRKPHHKKWNWQGYYRWPHRDC